MKQINYEEEHRKLWNWLADHPGAEKADYFADWDDQDVPQDRCFACEVAIQRAIRVKVDKYCTYCMFCPLGGGRIVGCVGGVYAEWRLEEQPNKRRQLALQIANLSWKEKEND